MMAYRIFGGVAVEGYFKIFEPIAKLSNVIIILKLRDVRRVKFNVFMAHNRLRVTRINLTIIIKS